MGGRILAINEGAGYRPIIRVARVLYVQQFNARPPSTILYGSQLMTPQDDPAAYNVFMHGSGCHPLIWAQLRLATEDSPEQVFAIWPRLPLDLIAQEQLQAVAYGKDPLQGYYVMFPGHIRIFSHPNWWDDSEDSGPFTPLDMQDRAQPLKAREVPTGDTFLNNPDVLGG